MNMKTYGRLALAIGASVVAQAALAGGGWYAGVGLGQSTDSDWVSKSDMLEALDAGRAAAGIYGFSGTTSASSDDSDTGWKIYGGYELDKNFALEVAYLDLGEATAKASGTGDAIMSGVGPISGTLSTRLSSEAEALTLDAVGRINATPWLELFARAGVYRADLDVKVTAVVDLDIGAATASESDDDSSTGLHVALGAGFIATPQITVRAEWERLSQVDFGDDDTDIDLLSISAAYRF